MPQSDEMIRRSGGMCLSASRISAATCSGRSAIASLVALPELLASGRVALQQTYNPPPLMAAG
jgi:hypothetical protein